MPIVKLNKNLKHIAFDQGVNLIEIANELRVSPALVSFYANGHKPIPYKYIDQISGILGVSKKQLLEELNVVK